MLLSVLVIVVGLQANLKLASLFAVGILLGITLLKSAFGFSVAYRRAFLYRDLRGVKAQIFMLFLGTCFFVPILASGNVFGHGVSGAVAPPGLQAIAGAFLFGLGMQLGGGCGSGALYTLGGGSPRMLVTLIAFITGSFWASLHMQWWWELPSLPAISLGGAQSALNGPLLHDTTSLMNIGIIMGAFLAAVISNRFAPRLLFNLRWLAAAVIGGLAMGYGARIGFGCNIGAFFPA